MSVALFAKREKAEPVAERLRQHGLAAEISDKPRLAWLWFVSKSAGGVEIEVPAEQFERAEQLLLDWDAAENFLEGAIRCPECGSLRVEYPQIARHSVLTNLIIGLAAEFRLVERDYYCEDCHFAWPRKGTRPRRRAHMAPYYFIEGVEQTTRARGGDEHRERKAA